MAPPSVQPPPCAQPSLPALPSHQPAGGQAPLACAFLKPRENLSFPPTRSKLQLGAHAPPLSPHTADKLGDSYKTCTGKTHTYRASDSAGRRSLLEHKVLPIRVPALSCTLSLEWLTCCPHKLAPQQVTTNHRGPPSFPKRNRFLAAHARLAPLRWAPPCPPSSPGSLPRPGPRNPAHQGREDRPRNAAS